jgi:hypothetical protein
VLDFLPLLNVVRTESNVYDQRAAHCGIAVQPDAIEMHDEGITRYRAFDVKRTGKRISA